MTRRIQFGLTDYERREQDTKRRVRNCFIALAVLVALMGLCSAL